ncbi:MAG: MFS transporter [Bosea sp. (in: a-proteobacteria)]
MTSSPTALRYSPDSRYAWFRLVLSLILGTTACVGNWSVVVVLPTVQAEFGVLRAGASLPFTAVMVGFAFGSIVMGKIADRYGLSVPIALGGLLLLSGYTLASQATSLPQFALAHGLLIGIGSAAGFAPLIADLSHWFVKRRGLAVVMGATGSYLAGAIWPQVVTWGLANHGWRPTHLAIGLFACTVMLPLAWVMRIRPSAETMHQAEQATEAARGDLGLSPAALQGLLLVAGFACCVAMSMPQVHIVAYCSDLGYGVARGAEMLSIMMLLGVVSRLASGFVADKIGGVATLMIGSVMQAVALFFYLWFDGLTSLYLISAIFGLFQGGIVPMYAVIIREYLPPREAGVRIGFVMMATILGMAAGGYLSGLIFDQTASYRMAFLNGLLWNGLNLAVVAWLMMRGRRRWQVA